MRILKTNPIIAVILISLASGALPSVAADLVGTVAGRDGKPIGEFQISLADAAGKKIGDVRSDSQGHYEFRNIPAGQYTLTASNRTAVSYIDDGGLTVDWGIGDGVMPLAIAFPGAAGESAATK